MKNIVKIIFIVFVVLIGCKKDNTTTTATNYTISGTIYLDCNAPLANASLEFDQGSSLLGHAGTIGTTKTDAHGNFSFTYKFNDNTSPIIIMTNVGGISPISILENIPVDYNITNIKCYYRASSTLIIKITTTNPLTINDTLFLFDLTNYYIGPFLNGAILDSISCKRQYSKDYNDLKSPFVLEKYPWAIGRNNFFYDQNIINFNYNRACGSVNIMTIPIN